MVVWRDKFNLQLPHNHIKCDEETFYIAFNWLLLQTIRYTDI